MNIHDIARQYMRQDRTRSKTSKNLRQHDTRQDKTRRQAKPSHDKKKALVEAKPFKNSEEKLELETGLFLICTWIKVMLLIFQTLKFAEIYDFLKTNNC